MHSILTEEGFGWKISSIKFYVKDILGFFWIRCMKESLESFRYRKETRLMYAIGWMRSTTLRWIIRRCHLDLDLSLFCIGSHKAQLYGIHRLRVIFYNYFLSWICKQLVFNKFWLLSYYYKRRSIPWNNYKIAKIYLKLFP